MIEQWPGKYLWNTSFPTSHTAIICLYGHTKWKFIMDNTIQIIKGNGIYKSLMNLVLYIGIFSFPEQRNFIPIIVHAHYCDQSKLGGWDGSAEIFLCKSCKFYFCDWSENQIASHMEIVIISDLKRMCHVPFVLLYGK